MKKAFTLIELLVVIAIIAILAAILFPVFAQAKAAAKMATYLSNTKQTATATIIYTNDYDDTFPLAGVLRPAGGKLGMGVAYPFPYNDGEITPSGNPIWQQAARQQMAMAWVGNAIQPYTKNYGIMAFSGNNNYNDGRTFPTTGGFAAPQYGTLTFNGLLHRYSATSVAAPSTAIMWWSGNGQDNLDGILATDPALNCSNVIDDCMFNSGAPPSAVPSAFPSAPVGDVEFIDGNPNEQLTFSNKKAPFVRTDTSAKVLPQGSQVYPSYNSNPWVDPYAYTYYAGGPGPGVAVEKSTGFGFSFCTDANTLATTLTKATYDCYFRPDRTK